MQLPRRRRPDFEDPAGFEVPQHLREAVAQAPQAAGIYTFHGEANDLPLYIGKSVNLRSRLQAHLRNPDEARLLRQTHRISVTRTAGEIGALLLEAQLIKQRKPLFNQKLRDTRQLCSLQLSEGGLAVASSKELDFALAPGLYGLFGSRAAALDALRDLADAHRLCYGALGLEKLTPGRACFRSGIGRCAGLCRGSETQDAHDARLLDALLPWQVEPWPHEGAIGVYERDEALVQIHVVRHWSYLGSAATEAKARKLAAAPAAFDADVYRILARPLLEGALELVAL